MDKKETIAKLFALSDSPNVNEAMEAREKAFAMMRKYGYTKADIPTFSTHFKASSSSYSEASYEGQCTYFEEGGFWKTNIVGKKSSPYFRDVVTIIATCFGVKVKFVSEPIGKERVYLSCKDEALFLFCWEDLDQSLKFIDKTIYRYKKGRLPHEYTRLARENIDLCIAAGFMVGSSEPRKIILKRNNVWRDWREDSAKNPFVTDFHWPDDELCAYAYSYGYMRGKHGLYNVDMGDWVNTMTKCEG